LLKKIIGLSKSRWWPDHEAVTNFQLGTTLPYSSKSPITYFTRDSLFLEERDGLINKHAKISVGAWLAPPVLSNIKRDKIHGKKKS
jgi:hypothetical protein